MAHGLDDQIIDVQFPARVVINSRFFRAFSSVVRQMPGYTSQKRATACTLPNFYVICIFVLFYLFVLCRSLYCLCVLVYVY